LRLAGFGLSLDDFGEGENRFDRLLDLPLTELKLDRRFVRALDTPHGVQIAAGMIAFARALGVKCVAEGVETLDQAVLLRELGCDQGQGLLFGRPNSAEHALQLWGCN
jgi:EAL domain-containing protein (putative c-di-GMP-specific phosphodiesterase class I)